tara:strand:- start:76 stop:1653 length:1578 start_codon:yes stop_codon:yes gene_type:complete
MTNQNNLTELILFAARSNLSGKALWAMDESLNYKDLLERAGKLSNAIISTGLKKGDRVAILFERSCGLYIAILASLFCGAVYVPLNPRFPNLRNKNILKRSGASVLIVDESNLLLALDISKSSDFSGSIILPESDCEKFKKELVICKSEVDKKSSEICPPKINQNDIAYLLFTSGSTGEPKGVPITHGNLCAYIRGIKSINKVTSKDRIIQIVSVTFDLSAHDIFLAWTSGAALYSLPENYGALAGRFVEEFEITCWLSVPSTAALMNDAGVLKRSSMPSLRMSYFCGEALSDCIAKKWSEAAPNSSLINLYGPTEATIAISYFVYDPYAIDRTSILPIGRPLGNEKMAVINHRGEFLPKGELGELHLSGFQLSHGYWENDKITEERFVQYGDTRWYRTGDLVREISNGNFLYAGRSDHQVKIMGYRVELLEIEAVLREQFKTNLVAVVALPKNESGNITGCAAFVVSKKIDSKHLELCLRKKLPFYMIPKRIALLEKMPLNTNGKIDYSALLENEWMQLAKEFK